jgi:MoaA/NifB/PqqE/SkfB family radical SAM enzyme
MVRMMFDQTVRIFDLLKIYLNTYLTKKPARYTHEITRRCNLICPDCYVYNFNSLYKGLTRKEIFKDIENKELSYEQYRNIFTNEIKQGCKSVFLIGGEPTLRMDIIELAYNYFGRNMTLITNGLINIPRYMKFPFAVSIDGGEKVHDKIRGRGTWKDIYNNYSDDHRVMLSCCLRKNTANQIQTIIDNWIDTSVFGVSFFFLTPPKDNSDVTVLGEERRYAKDELHKVVDEYPNFVRMTHNLVDLLCDTNKGECPVFRYAKWYNYQGHPVDNCLLGTEADCSLCGCISPLYLRMISKWWKYFDIRALNIFTLPRDIKQCRKPGEK